MITVELPNGRTVQFPDGTTREQIRTQLQQQGLMPTRAERATESGAGIMRNLGLGARAVTEGLAAVPGMIYDAAAIPVNMGARALGLPEAPQAAGQVRAGLTALGVPEPETRGERIVSRGVQEVAAALPMGLAGYAVRTAPGLLGRVGQALSTGPGTQAAAAAGSGLAGGYAAERGAGLLGETGAGLLGAVGGTLAAAGGRGGAAALAPLTEAGRRGIVRDVLLERTDDPATLGARLGAGVDDPNRRLPGVTPTAAQAARDTRLAVTEGAMRNADGQPIRMADFERNAARYAAIDAMIDGAAPDARGSRVREALQASRQAFRARVREAYASIDPDNTTQVDARDIGGPMQAIIDRYYGPGAGQPPGVLARVMADVAGADTTNWRFLQGVRMRLGNEASQASVRGDNTAAAAANGMRDALDEALAEVVTRGGGEFTAQQRRLWQDASDLRRTMGRLFETDEQGYDAVGRILRPGPFGVPGMEMREVAPEAIASPGAIRQVLAAAGTRHNTVRDALRGQFIDDLVRVGVTQSTLPDAAGNIVPQVSAANLQRFLTRNRETVGLLFGRSPEGATIERLVNDLQEGLMAQAMRRTEGSPTAQNLSVMAIISRATGGLVDPSNPLAQTITGLGPVVGLMYRAPEAAMRQLLAEALADARLARALVDTASPAAIQRAQRLLRPLEQRFRLLAEEQAARLAARATGAEAVQQQAPQ